MYALVQKIIFLFCSSELKAMIQKRAQCLEYNISEYLKYLVVKDIFDKDTRKDKN